jgi:hypothetical protein
MKKNPSILMAALTLTAIVLAVVLLATPPRQAQALMLNNEPGLTMMTSGQAQGADELLIIIDKSTGKMLVYRLNQNSFELMGSTDINTIFQNPRSR